MSAKWTEAQQDAINAKDRNILVCAAAGSGKTTTLTERIIRRLTDPENPSDISRMLVVTFTRNAASELKEKIYKALSAALEADPKNKFLAMQMMKLPSARISTIHSFCFDIVKRNAAKLGLPSSVKNESAPEGELRARRVMNEVVSDFYDEVKNEKLSADFARLAECVTSAKNEGTLADIFLELYKTLCSYQGGAETLRKTAQRCAEEYKGEFFDSSYGRVYKSMLYKKLSSYEKKYKKIITLLAEESAGHPYLPALNSDVRIIEFLFDRAQKGYVEAARALLDVDFGKLGSLKKDDATVNSDNAKALRSLFKDDIKKLRTLFEYRSEEAIHYADASVAALSFTLSRVLCEFEERFRQDKKEAGVLDYNDLEYYAEKVLYDGDEPSDAAREIAELTDEIYIDEYQDVNEVQDRIFAAVSNGHNLFMVGDVKQSIYSFRGGEPSIFTSRRDSYGEFKREEPSNESCSIFMQNNFRCDLRVIDFVNRIFATLLGEANGRFKYISQDELVYTKNGGVVSENEVYPRLVICEDDGISSKSFSAQAAFVADEIVRLINTERKNDGTPISPEDIAILLRSDKSTASAYKRELERRGVPVTTGDKTPFYNSAEVKLALCLLNAIDNPHKDVYLAGALLSGIYGFSADELVKIKREYKDSVSLYDAVVCYARDLGDEKCRAFIEANNRYREISKTASTDALIWQIYEECAFISLASAECTSVYERRRVKKNCMALYDCARTYEQGGFRGLYSFLEYIENMIRNNLAAESESEFADGAVKIMSIHASKGLEFPVCFVCETQKSFNLEDSRRSLLYDRDVGIGFKVREPGSVAVVDTPHRQAVGIYKNMLVGEEEMRILYVALTRARERLYVTAKPPHASSADKMLERAAFRAEFFSKDTVSELTNYADAILLCLAKSPSNILCERAVMSEYADIAVLQTSRGENRSEKSASFEDTERTLSLLRDRMSYAYPYEEMTKIKAKMSVSKLYPGVLDEDDGEAAELTESEKADVRFKSLPEFLKEESEPDGAAKGTATHLIMQFADFDNMKQHGVERELERLVSEGFIDRNAAESANKEEIGAFLKSGFFARMTGAKRLWREFRFNLRLDAASFTENKEKADELDGETLLVQGVIDGFFLEGDNIVLFDYKTDRLTDYEISHPELAEKKLCERHAQQLYYYKLALEEMFAREVCDVYIYSLPLGREVRVDFSAVMK